jgi:uncharacterized membrane protein
MESDSTTFHPKLHSAIALLAIAGLTDSIYLLIKHLTGEDVTCIASSGCGEVLSSAYSKIGSIPLGAVGAVGYFIAFSLALLTAFGSSGARTLLRLQVAGMFCVTLWLLYVQAFILHAFCDYCLLSAALTTTITALVVISLVLGKKQQSSTSQPVTAGLH